MPFEVIAVTVERPSAAMLPDGAGGYKIGPPIAVEGSPFQCRAYRNSDTSVNRTQEAAGAVTVERRRALQFLDVNAKVLEGDEAILPSGERVTIIRKRDYGVSLQCDIEAGTARKSA